MATRARRFTLLHGLLALSLALLSGCEALAGLTGSRDVLEPIAHGGTAGVAGASNQSGASGLNSSGGSALGAGTAGEAGESGEAGASAAGTSGSAASGASGASGAAGLGGAGSSGMSGGANGGGANGGGASGGFAGVYGTDAPSCVGMDTDQTAGAGGIKCRTVSCCSALPVPGGTFPMGRSETGSDMYPIGADSDQPEHSVTISPFALDQFEVTVGRFRRFVDHFDGTPPAVGAGANAHVASSGWQQVWNSQLPASRDALRSTLKCAASTQTWTDAAGYNEVLPINCIPWFVAFDFCAWDDGRLPSEAEWEFAAAGGDANRLYPWGSAVPAADLAIYNCVGAGTAGTCTFADITPVGSRPKGDGRYGQADLAGSMWEHTRDAFDKDFYSSSGATLPNPINLNTNVDQFGFITLRGSSWVGPGNLLRAALRNTLARSTTYDGVGFRCARDL